MTMLKDKPAANTNGAADRDALRRTGPVSLTRSYEELDGAQGREVFFRPQRFRAEDLEPLVVDVEITVAGRAWGCRFVDVSQGGVAFVWPDQLHGAESQGVDGIAVRIDSVDVYTGEARVASARQVDGLTVVGMSFVGVLLQMDHILQLRDVRCWRANANQGLRAAAQSWHTGGHDTFKGQVAELALYLQDANHALTELEDSLPWHVIHGEVDVPARDAVIARIRKDFVPDLLGFAQRLDDALRLASPTEWQALKQFSLRQVHGYLMQSPWMRRAFEKPLGYPGDYEVMKYVYERQFEGRSLFARAVSYAFLQAPASCAVRCRKDMVRGQLRQVVDGWQDPDQPLRILSVAAGPAQEVYELLGELETTPAPIEIILFDQDNGALAYAYSRIKRRVDERWPGRVHVTFLHDSIKRLLKDPKIFEHFGHFDAIVCAGLYDYLRVPTAVTLTRNLYSRLRSQGIVLIGNMVPENPSRWFMEQHLDWFLIYRSREEMLAIGQEATPDAAIDLVEEATGVNPFLRVRRP